MSDPCCAAPIYVVESFWYDGNAVTKDGIPVKVEFSNKQEALDYISKRLDEHHNIYHKIGHGN